MVLEAESARRLIAPAVLCEDFATDPDDPLALLTEHREVNLDMCMEALVLWAQAQFGSDQFVAAREEFDWKSGKVFHDDSFYDTRISYFLDFFVFERPISGAAADGRVETPIQSFMRQPDARVPKKVMEVFEELGKARHSFYQVSRPGIRRMQVKDLVSGEKLGVSARTGMTFEGISRSEIFQGFLLPFQSSLRLSVGSVFHSKLANTPIKRRIRAAVKKGVPEHNVRELLMDLAQAQLRLQRQPKADLKQIYAARKP